MRADYDVEVEWRAFELHPGIPPEGMAIPWPPARLAAGRASFARLADAAGLPYGERTHWYDSTPAHEATVWAHDHYPPDTEEEFRRAVFRAYFVHAQNIGAAGVLAELAAAQGLDAADLRSALAERRYLEQVRAQYEAARAVGVTGVPTFVAGGYALVGAQPYEVFRRLMAAAGTPPRSGDSCE